MIRCYEVLNTDVLRPVISKLGKKLQLRQRVIATATVFFRRFYAKNSYCATDPFMVLAACCYVAAKAEESPVPIKSVVSEARMLFSSMFRLLRIRRFILRDHLHLRIWRKNISVRQL